MVHIEIEEHRDSYIRMRNYNSCILWSGIGRMKSPGRPGGNQSYESQMRFLRAYNKERRISIYYKRLDGSTEYLGDYGIRSMEKKVSFAGFQYFEYMFLRIPRTRT